MTTGRHLPELEQAVMARNGKRTGDEGAFSCPEPQSHRNVETTTSSSRHGVRTRGRSNQMTALLDIEAARRAPILRVCEQPA